MTSSKRSLALAATLLAAVPASALAASTGPATPAAIKVEGAYAFHTTAYHSKADYVEVVFKTHGQLPRRYDGLIRAGADYGSSRGGSVGSIKSKASHCYAISFKLRDGRFYAADGKGPKATVGTSRKLTVSADDASGNEISASRQAKIVKKTAGSEKGAPLGC